MRAPRSGGTTPPKPTRAETRGDATNSAARAILNTEAAARLAKTERLRALRMAQEAAESGRAEEPASKPASGRKTHS